ncbi:MAG: glucosyl-3-phosphoglycerate phosphatase [Acidimicrobiaceae bacterium]|jgi:probable phosphoglycerate mutase|nr:glucosyl-3-phosphoglycerate phosphatase [Acidimicrobiaceae bacterium]
MARLLLLRHGQSVWNAQQRWQGQADPPLSPAGEAQARAAAEWLAGHGFDGVVTSDQQRARRTAELIADALGLPPPELEPGLQERHVGDWSGLTVEEVTTRWPGQLEAWRAGHLERPPNGEGHTEFGQRVMEVVERLADRPESALLVVTHGGVINRVGRALGAKWHSNFNLCGWWIEPGPTPGERAAPPDDEVQAAATTVL